MRVVVRVGQEKDVEVISRSRSRRRKKREFTDFSILLVERLDLLLSFKLLWSVWRTVGLSLGVGRI